MDFEFLKRTKELHILILGDVMIDRYLSGKVSRISPEAPVPVVRLNHRDERMGGAGNVALNIKALGATPILCSVLGTDENGATFKGLMDEQQLNTEGLSFSSTRKTTVKTRVLADDQQLLRVDDEDTSPLSSEEEKNYIENVQAILKNTRIDALLFQDYNKGVLTPKVIEYCIELAVAKNIPTIVDPKFRNFWAYKGVTLFKPNLKEIRQQLPFPIEVNNEDLRKAASFINKQLNNQISLITLSEKGLFLFEKDGIDGIFPTKKRTVADGCGAGDTVISIVAIGLALNLPLATIALLANTAGGLVCEKPGVVAIDAAQLLANVDSPFPKALISPYEQRD